MNTAIIIINWNATDDTLTCIESIKKWIAIPHQIYVVDNNSTHEEKERLFAQEKNFNLLKNKINAGFSGGCNIGIKAALNNGHDAIFLLNNDARIQEKDFNLLLEALISKPDIGVIGPVIYDANTNALLNAGGKNIGWHYISHWRHIADPQDIYEVDYVSGTAFLARGDVFKTIGLFDESYFFSGEVADFCKRIHNYRHPSRSHFKVTIHPQAKAVHDLHVSSAHRGPLYTYYTVRNRYIYIRKFFKVYIPILYPFWIYRHFLHAAISFMNKQKNVTKAVLKGILHGLIGKVGR
ncbi:MAG TPA: glycosyltransferase family 2 protein [Desulfobacterales bacterium]|nr:glycosyltransferase family 2 protein [Desulfobacterales bacterium]